MKIHMIYLASGSSRRFGGNKLLCPFAGKPLYRWGLDVLACVAAERNDCDLTVVSRYPEIRDAAAALGAQTADCPESELGVSYTIKAGLRALQGAVEASLAPEDFLLFVVADQPKLTAASVERLLACARDGAECAALCHGDRLGNPVLFGAHLAPELLALEGDTGGKAVLRRHDCVRVPAGSVEELEDVDTREALGATAF